MDVKLGIGYALGGAAFLYAVLAGHSVGSDHAESTLNVLLCIAGGISGWITGILITPRADEKRDFSKIGGALLTFVTGFVLAKLEPVLDTQLESGLDVSVLIPGLLFLVSFGVGALFVFVGRKYWQEDAGSA